MPTPRRTGTPPLLVLAKIRSILDAFSLARPELSLSEIRAATGLPVSTVHRLVANLVNEQFLDRSGDVYRMGIHVAFWAAPATQGLDALEVTRPVLASLRDVTGETACLFRIEREVRVCVALAETRHSIRREMHVGRILPLHAGSAGHVLLAWDSAAETAVTNGSLTRYTGSTITDPEELRLAVARTRRQRYAVSHDERDEGAAGVSAPVFDSTGAVFGALNLSGPSTRMTPERCAGLVEVVVSAADHATRLLGGRFP